jgi:hypothetical protein
MMASGRHKYNPKQNHLLPHFGGNDAGTVNKKTAIYRNVINQKILKGLIVTRTSGLAKYKEVIAHKATSKQAKEVEQRRFTLNGEHLNHLKTKRD